MIILAKYPDTYIWTGSIYCFFEAFENEFRVTCTGDPRNSRTFYMQIRLLPIC
jgi:hypothetical protein